MSEKSAEQIKAYYSELAKVGQSQDWEKILKVTKKSKPFVFFNLQFVWAGVLIDVWLFEFWACQ